MFKNETEFVQALLNGRGFKDPAGYTFYWDGKHFRRGVDKIKTFGGFDKVTEIFPEPAPFEPKPGDEILVWNVFEEQAYKLKVRGMFDGQYLTEHRDAEGTYESWLHAKSAPKENPWIERAPNTWPDCRPRDSIEVQDADRCNGHGKATYYDWVADHWVRWRLAK